MSQRRTILSNGEYYHVFNRGIARSNTFASKFDYVRFLKSLDFYRYDQNKVKLSALLQYEKDKRGLYMEESIRNCDTYVEIIAYVLMPNHFHLILKQLKDKGITVFMSKFVNSYTKYFNTRHERVGDLFQGVFKSVHIETDEQIMHLSRYIHLNPYVSRVVDLKDLQSYDWSSFSEYCTGNYKFINPDIILHNFKYRSSEKYGKFVLDYADYARRLDNIKQLILE